VCTSVGACLLSTPACLAMTQARTLVARYTWRPAFRGQGYTMKRGEGIRAPDDDNVLVRRANSPSANRSVLSHLSMKMADIIFSFVLQTLLVIQVGSCACGGQQRRPGLGSGSSIWADWVAVELEVMLGWVAIWDRESDLNRLLC